MVSIGFDAVAGLSSLSFAFKGVLAGRVHPVTRAATARSDLYMLQDAPAWYCLAACLLSWMVSLLAREHVLLVGVQHVSGMWVLRGMRMGAYFSALKVEATEVAKFGSMKEALQDAQQLAVGSPASCLAAVKYRRRGSTEASVVEWAREMEHARVASGWLWAVQSDGTVGLGMPQHQFVAGGDFAPALSDAAKARLEDVRQELREVGAELEMLTPAHRGVIAVYRSVPLSAQQSAGGSEAVLLTGGVGSDASPPAVGPMLRTMDLSLYPPVVVAPSQPLPGGDGQALSASVVSLSDLPAELQLQQVVAHSTAGHASDAGVVEITRLKASRRVGMTQIGVPPPCRTLLAEAGVYAENLADLPWTVLDSIVGEASGMGVAQVTLLRVLHERLQAEDARSGRSSRSGSRPSSRKGSKAGSRSGGGKQGAVRPHVPQQVQQQHTGVLSSAGDPPGASPWLVRFPAGGPGSVAAPGEAGGAGEPGRPVTPCFDETGDARGVLHAPDSVFVLLHMDTGWPPSDALESLDNFHDKRVESLLKLKERLIYFLPGEKDDKMAPDMGQDSQ